MQVIIKGHEWRIKLVDGLDKQTDPLGLCEYVGKNISLNYNMCDSNVRSTILHELTHAFEWEYGTVQVSHTHETLSDFVAAYADEIVRLGNYVERRYYQELKKIKH